MTTTTPPDDWINPRQAPLSDGWITDSRQVSGLGDWIGRRGAAGAKRGIVRTAREPVDLAPDATPQPIPMGASAFTVYIKNLLAAGMKLSPDEFENATRLGILPPPEKARGPAFAGQATVPAPAT